MRALFLALFFCAFIIRVFVVCTCVRAHIYAHTNDIRNLIYYYIIVVDR